MQGNARKGPATSRRVAQYLEDDVGGKFLDKQKAKSSKGGEAAFFMRYECVCLKKNLNAPRPSEHPPVWGKKCQNV